MATFFYLLLFIYLAATGQLEYRLADSLDIGWVQLISGASLVLLCALNYLLLLPALRKAESNLTPRVIELYMRDGKLRLTWSFCLLFGFLSLLLAALPGLGPRPAMDYLWLLGLALTIDLLALSFRWNSDYLDPFKVVSIYGGRANSVMGRREDAEITPWLDTLSTTAIHAVHDANFSLVRATLSEIMAIDRELVKTKLLQAEDPATDPATAYVLGFTYERLSLIHEAALQDGYTPVSSNLLSSLGKQAVMLSQRASQLSTLAIAQMGRIADEALIHDQPEIMDKSSYALVGVARALIDESDLEHIDLTAPLISIIAHLEEIAKDLFQRDKETELRLLVQPLKALEQVLGREDLQSRADVGSAMKDLQRVFGEFAALGLVMLRKSGQGGAKEVLSEEDVLPEEENPAAEEAPPEESSQD